MLVQNILLEKSIFLKYNHTEVFSLNISTLCSNFLNFFLGIPGCYEYNMDYPGNDLVCLASKTLNECQAECQTNAKCKFWTSISDGHCCLKTSNAGKKYKDTCISGPKTCP